MILYIAEKPSLGRALAAALPKPHQKGDGFITLGNGDVVSWCIGHLLEQAQPDHYDSKYKHWKTEHLPIVPTQWQLSIKPKTRKQFTTLKRLIKQATQLVNVGDPDREGQILIDEVINHCRTPKAKVLATKRCLVHDLNPRAVKKALSNLRDNTEFIPLATSALARARADWLYGINMTRLCTVQGQQSGFKGVLSVGRVQTPLLGLVVKRDAEIEAFTSKPFYELSVTLQSSLPYEFDAKWQPSEACTPYQDDEGRILSRKLTENVAARVINQAGVISDISTRIKKQPPPLPYHLSSLQIDAAKRFGLSAKQVLDICQNLYEKHTLITYPRSDCRHLPSEHFNESGAVINAINHNAPALRDITQQTNTSLRTKAWDDKKVGAHHAIIPTHKTLAANKLTKDERDIYELIARQYAIQFLPSFDYRQIIIDCTIAGGMFIARRKEIITLGWKAAFPARSKAATTGTTDDDEFTTQTMPELKKGEPLTCIDTHIHDKQTTPPKRFNDATLLAAMTGIARYVKDPAIRKILRDTDGLGTEATRAGIIELLFTREYLIRKGKEIHASDIARQFIQCLPESVSLPDMTAQWESELNAISQKKLPYQQFMSPMTHALHQLIEHVSSLNFTGLQGKGRAPSRRRLNNTTKSNNTKQARTNKTTEKKPRLKKARSKVSTKSAQKKRAL